MAKVPDLGSDFAQKLLRDLRRRRERLGFESSAAAPAKGTTPSAAAPGEGSSIARPGTPRRHDAPVVAHSNAIVPFQGGVGRGGKQTAPAANAGSVDVQMALALALSNSGKLQNVHLVARQGAGRSMFYGEPGRTGTASQARHLLAPGADVGKVAIGVQKLNDILVAYSSASAMLISVARRLLATALLNRHSSPAPSPCHPAPFPLLNVADSCSYLLLVALLAACMSCSCLLLAACMRPWPRMKSMFRTAGGKWKDGGKKIERRASMSFCSSV